MKEQTIKDRGGQIPYGKKRSNGKIVDHISKQKITQRMIRLRREGHSYSAIAKVLNNSVIPGKNHGNCEHERILSLSLSVLFFSLVSIANTTIAAGTAPRIVTDG